MPKTLRLLSLAALLASGTSLAMAAQDVGQQSTTGTMTGSQQAPTPATGAATSPTYTYPRSGAGTPGVSAQMAGPRYPGAVGPTGSTQPDATNPVRSNPSGGGGTGSGGGNGNSSR